jgi:rubredoxin/GNAT superfamily N-acetyltransferase
MSVFPEIRTATNSDVERCTELLEILFSEEHEFIPNAETQSKALSMIIRNPELGRIFVADIDGVSQGMVMLLFTVSTFLGKKVALLEDMVVAPVWRSMGLGNRLIDHALDFARREGFGRITLLTDADNETARHFYLSKGFSKSEMVVYRKLLDEESILKTSEDNARMCQECGYVYDPAEGDPDNAIKPGTRFEKISDEWACPVCFAGKAMFDILA